MPGVLNTSQILMAGRQGHASHPAIHVPTTSRLVPRRMTRPSFRARVSSATPSTEPKPDPFATKEVYSDSDPISKFSIWYFSKVMSENLGNKPFDGTYESFVELSREIMRGRTTKQQQETVASVLGNLLPPQSPQRFRQWFPLSRRTAEFNAWITTLGFTWLVRKYGKKIFRKKNPADLFSLFPDKPPTPAFFPTIKTEYPTCSLFSFSGGPVRANRGRN